MISTQQAPAASAFPDCVPPRRLKLSACFDRLLRKALRLLAGPGRRRLMLPTAVSSPTRLRVVGYTNDRRNRWLAMAGRHLDDRAIEAKWRARVAVHPVERRRLGLDRPYVRESLSAFTRRQAD